MKEEKQPNNIIHKGRKALRDIFVGLFPIFLGVAVCVVSITFSNSFDKTVPVIVAAISIFLIPYILYRFVPLFSFQNNLTVRFLYGIVAFAIFACIVAIIGFLLFTFVFTVKNAPEYYNEWSSKKSEERLFELRTCYQNSSCVLSAEELSELRVLEKKHR